MRKGGNFGLVQVYWGNGKGKTTSALGTSLRALASGYKVHLVQFMKDGKSSEVKALRKFRNFSAKSFAPKTWFSEKTIKEHEKKANEAFSHLKSSFRKKYNLIIADELLYAVQFGLISEESVINLIKKKPKNIELIITGSHKPFPKIFAVADLVTEIRKIKHPYDRGIKARKGIEF
jgi:cob(I)alamin adenosyltransferase